MHSPGRDVKSQIVQALMQGLPQQEGRYADALRQMQDEQERLGPARPDARNMPEHHRWRERNPTRDPMNDPLGRILLGEAI